MKNFHLQKKISLAFGISILLLIITLALSFYNYSRLLNKSEWVEHTNQVMLNLEGILTHMKDAETGQRGYLLTGDSEFLEPYIGSYYKVIQNYKTTKHLTSDNPVQQERLDTLIVLINERFNYLNKTIALEKSGETDSAMTIISSKAGKKIMDDIRALLKRMKNEERELKSERYLAARDSSFLASSFILICCLMCLMIIGVAFYITKNGIKKEIQLKKELMTAYEKIKETNEELSITEEHLKELNERLEKKAEEKANEIIEKERQYNFVIDFIPQFVWTSNKEGQVQSLNKNWLNYTGQSLEEALNMGWTKAIHKEDLPATMIAISKAANAIEEFKTEYRIRKYDGTYRWFSATGAPIKNEKSDLVKWFGISTDIQDQKDVIESLEQNKEKLKESNAELSKQNEKLQKINNDLDNFIYTASHDLKAPIANIEGLITILKKKECYSANDSKGLIDMIEKSSQKLKNVIEDLAVIIRVQNEVDVDVEDINVNDVVDEVKISISDMLSTSGAQTFVDCVSCPSIKFSRRNFRSILFNLLSNAIKYKSPERIPEIHFKTENIDGYRVLQVSDNGLGIDGEKKDKIFSMFKRLHHHVEGSGIGLFIVKRIIDNAKGKIEVESEIGKGTIFKVYFPEN